MKNSLTSHFKIDPEQKKILHQVKLWTESFFVKYEKNLDKGGHGLDHSQRVVGLAMLLSEREKKPPFLPLLAALVHDIGRVITRDPRSSTSSHGHLSAELAHEFINSLDGLTLLEKEIVLQAIVDHPKKNEAVRVNYVVQILMDADRLDAIGSIGLLRSASNRWHLPLYLPQILNQTSDNKIQSIYQDFSLRILEFNDMLWTKSAREIAKSRVIFLKQFIQEFDQEIDLSYTKFVDLDL